MTPTQQVAQIQLAMGVIAKEYALSIPSNAINFGANINGRPTDPVSYILYMLGSRFESLEDERSVSAGIALLDFTSRFDERFDQLLTRFDLVRHETEMVGAGITNYHTISTILLRAMTES